MCELQNIVSKYLKCVQTNKINLKITGIYRIIRVFRSGRNIIIGFGFSRVALAAVKIFAVCSNVQFWQSTATDMISKTTKL